MGTAKMTERERKDRIEQLRAQLNELAVKPRDDWHIANEAVLRIEFYEYGDKITIESEHVIGSGPPRTDYLIISELESVEYEKEIFRIFRKHNVIEYKNPDDALDMRTIRKLVGYGNMYAADAKHKEDIEEGQVTLSVFRYSRPRSLFAQLEKRDDVSIVKAYPGVYYVQGITDMPLQIVVTSELKGEVYASYRAISARASESDICEIISEGEKNRISI